jgi:quercetin dioxygenase-like cupin family protein
MSATVVRHRDEFEVTAGSGGCTWMLARKALGTEGFGYNLVEIAPGGALPEHDESGGGQVELYVILEGEAVLSLDGEEQVAPAGTFACVDPTSTRSILNRSAEPVTALLVGVVPAPDYRPPGWA